MQTKLLKKLHLIFKSIFFYFLFSGNVLCAEEMKAGDKLKENSYVFTIPEAEKLKARIIDLEQKEKLYFEFEKLNNLRLEQNNLLILNLELKDKQIESYKKIITEYDNLNKIKEKNFNKKIIINTALVLSGVALTTVSIWSADKFDDSLEK